jgi:predicted glutamine amidotransferase
MCQLLGMSCNTPTDICFSFSGFRARGGLTDVHKDGWGIAFFEGKGVRQFLDPLPSAKSPVAELVRKYPIKSKTVISHIRKATQGAVALENTHPFMRELWGYYWIFAHNGNIPDFKPELDGAFLPAGTTDSERVFCWIMQEFRKKFGAKVPNSYEIFEYLTELSERLGRLGEFNFLLSNGETLFAHCSTKLAYVVRQAPFSKATLKDDEMSVDFNWVASKTDRVAVIATTPLTENENWVLMEPGSLWMFYEGAPVGQKPTIAWIKSESEQVQKT